MERHVYEEVMYGFPLRMENITDYIKDRRTFARKESLEAFFGSIKLISLPRHYRPGEILPELKWLEIFKKFAQYCQDPVKFLSDQPIYHEKMKDYWNFDNSNDTRGLYLCFHDFSSIEFQKVPFLPEMFRIKMDWVNEFNGRPTILEEDWRKSFKPTPKELADDNTFIMCGRNLAWYPHLKQGYVWTPEKLPWNK